MKFPKKYKYFDLRSSLIFRNTNKLNFRKWYKKMLVPYKREEIKLLFPYKKEDEKVVDPVEIEQS